MDIRKVSNDGKHTKEKAIVRFLQLGGGFRTPKEIWVGEDKFGHELCEPTKKGLLSSIEMNNTLFTEHPELLNLNTMKA